VGYHHGSNSCLSSSQITLLLHLLCNADEIEEAGKMQKCEVHWSIPCVLVCRTNQVRFPLVLADLRLRLKEWRREIEAQTVCVAQVVRPKLYCIRHGRLAFEALVKINRKKSDFRPSIQLLGTLCRNWRCRCRFGQHV
jgi:hypothetical protein